MNKEEQHFAIATACGLKNVHMVTIQNVTKQGDDRKIGITSDSGWVPDYLNDLNAMHEAEKVLTKDAFLVDAYFNYIRDNFGQAWHATASQRAEAFLKTLGLWSDVPSDSFMNAQKKDEAND